MDARQFGGSRGVAAERTEYPEEAWTGCAPDGRRCCPRHGSGGLGHGRSVVAGAGGGLGGVPSSASRPLRLVASDGDGPAAPSRGANTRHSAVPTAGGARAEVAGGACGATPACIPSRRIPLGRHQRAASRRSPGQQRIDHWWHRPRIQGAAARGSPGTRAASPTGPWPHRAPAPPQGQVLLRLRHAAGRAAHSARRCHLGHHRRVLRRAGRRRLQPTHAAPSARADTAVVLVIVRLA